MLGWHRVNAKSSGAANTRLGGVSELWYIERMKSETEEVRVVRCQVSRGPVSGERDSKFSLTATLKCGRNGRSKKLRGFFVRQ
jgi:hypothetical protein